MRLIDADALRISMMCRFDEVAELLEIIDEQPTAYDVDKVVEDIGKIEVGGDCRHYCKYYDWSVGACQGICEDYVRNRAIDIVRRGVING